MGTTFKIYFPRVHRASENKPADTENRIAEADLRGTETLLLVEDESAVRYAALEFLKKCGYTVIEAKDGLSAVDAANKHAGSDRRSHARNGRWPTRGDSRREVPKYKSALHVWLCRDHRPQPQNYGLGSKLEFPAKTFQS